MIATSIEQIPNIPCFDDSPRGRLLHGAAYLFHHPGYAPPPARELPQCTGIPSGTLFHHLQSKDDILAHVMEQTIIYNLARLNDAATQYTDPEQQLRALIKAELISITGDTGAAMAVLVYEWFALSKEKQDYLLKMRNEYEQIWLDVIEKLRTQGKVKHDAFIWRRLIGGAISWTVTWYKSEGKVKIDELTEMVWEMALK